jgi:hypothetical protein
MIADIYPQIGIQALFTDYPQTEIRLFRHSLLRNFSYPTKNSFGDWVCLPYECSHTFWKRLIPYNCIMESHI